LLEEDSFWKRWNTCTEFKPVWKLDLYSCLCSSKILNLE